MKFALFLVLCLAFAFVVESFSEKKVFEEEQGNEKRRPKRCTWDGDCWFRQCCDTSNFCRTKKAWGQTCHPRSRCVQRCQWPLVCKKTNVRPMLTVVKENAVSRSAGLWRSVFLKEDCFGVAIQSLIVKSVVKITSSVAPKGAFLAPANLMKNG
ncbi:hypothetical protein ACROYT_G008931 [Oculina patagonica]